jgi:hypothetical protein
MASWPRCPGVPALPAQSSWRGMCFAAAAEAPAAAAPPPPPGAVQEAHGFELQRMQWVREYDSHVLIYRHKKTGG